VNTNRQETTREHGPYWREHGQYVPTQALRKRRNLQQNIARFEKYFTLEFSVRVTLTLFFFGKKQKCWKNKKIVKNIERDK